MASYTNVYYAAWANTKMTGYLYIDVLDAPGIDLPPAEELILRDKQTKINYVCEGWDDHIIGLNCEFEIVNDKDDFFDLLPLMTATEKQYKVRVYAFPPDEDTVTLFEGFLNCETVEQKYLWRQSIRFVASSYLSKLDYLYPACIDTLQDMTFIDIIDAVLIETGSNFDIRINSDLLADGITLYPGQTLFNKTGVTTEVFWIDNVERKTGLEILESILKTFDCYIYWWNGYWYIEQVEELWNTTTEYVEYETGTSYQPTDQGTDVELTKVEHSLHALTFINQSQTISIIPGYKQIDVTLPDSGLFFNLILNDFALSVSVSADLVEPSLRGWKHWVDSYFTWSDFGVAYKNITVAIKRALSPGFEWNDLFSHGLYTKFKVTIAEDTILNIKYKFACNTDIFLPEYTMEQYTFLFPFYLRDLDSVNGKGYLFYDEETEVWNRQSKNTPYEGTQLYNFISGTEFDEGNKSCEITLSIPLGEIYGPEGEIIDGLGDRSFVLCIGTERYKINSSYQQQCTLGVYGDVVITVNSETLFNVVQGTIDTGFLEKKEISLDFADRNNWNYKNGVLIGDTTLSVRSDVWNETGGTPVDRTLIQRILRNQFRLHNVARQKLSGTVKILDTSLMQPLMLFEDAKQSDKKFILLSYTFNLTENEYVIALYEYDNSTVVNITQT